MRYGIVGAGYFGAELARIAHGLPESQVSVVFSPEHAIPLARELGARVATDVRAVCTGPDVDAIIIASPNDAHREPAVVGAAAGKHVFCEKPVALSTADARTMVDAAHGAGVAFMAGHVTQFMHGVREARRRIAAGEIGQLLVAQAARTGWEPAAGGEVSWKKMRAHSGGHLFHHIHELDLVLALLGPACSVTMVGGNLAHQGVGSGDEDDVLLATLEHADGAFSQLQWGSAFRWPEHYVTVQGTLGAIRVDLQDVGVTMRSNGGVERWPLHRSWGEDQERREEYAAARGGGGVTYGSPGTRPPGWLRAIMRDELEWFEAVVAGREQPGPDLAGLVDGSAALTSVLTAEALTTSLAENRKVPLREVSSR